MPGFVEELIQIEREAKEECSQIESAERLEALRVKYLGRKGRLSQTLPSLKALSGDERPVAGREANRIKDVLTRLFRDKEDHLKASPPSPQNASSDLTMPGTAARLGALHPLTQVTDEICAIFSRMGFETVSGPEMETEYHNFEALNIPLEHPSRDSFDTFYLDNHKLLRSQTSTVQIRIMEKHAPPLKIIAPGRVFRPDATDASHSFMFHQIEGLLVDTQVSFADLKGVLFAFAKSFFGTNVKLRFRPHFFPFTEPSAEVDVSCVMCKGSGCRVCSQEGWLEILGAGMVHPRVLQKVKISTQKYRGFAFGMGVERIAMLRWGIEDIRLFYDNDIRFLRRLR